MEMTLAILQRALQAAALRQAVLAHNVANANTPGFKRSRVDFESHLQAALAARAAGEPADPAGVAPVVAVEPGSVGRADGNNVDIELEMTQMAVNQIWHAALTRQVSDHFSRLRLAIFEGRR